MALSLLTGTPPCPCCAYGHAETLFPGSLRSIFGATTAHHSAARAAAAAPRIAPELRIDGANVVDPRDGSVATNMSIRMRMGRILSVTPTRDEDEPGVERIDASGKWVVPGYNDMHSHVLELANPSGSLALMLAEGVTGFRQMSGSPALLAKRGADALPLDERAPQLLQTPGSFLTPFNAGTPEGARAEVRRQKEQGADFIKVGLVRPDIFFAALEEAQRIGIPMLGHLQEGTDALEAATAGFHSVEHLGPGSTVWISCSSEEEELRADSYRREFIKAPPFKIPFLEKIIMKKLGKMLINPAAFASEADVSRLGRAIDSFSRDKGERVAEHFVKAGTWHCPTMVRLRTQQYADRPEYEQDELLGYLPEKAIRNWREVTAKFKGLPDAMRKTYDHAYPREQMLAKLLSDAGVKMICGTDGGSMMGPGMTLRQEFKELSDAGISPHKILQMATVNAADYLGRGDAMGLVEGGYDADLVLLDANPLDRVENLHAISGVVRAGFYHARRDLDAMKARVAANRGTLN